MIRLTCCRKNDLETAKPDRIFAGKTRSEGSDSHHAVGALQHEDWHQGVRTCLGEQPSRHGRIDSESGPLNHPNWRDGVRIGPLDEDRITAFIPPFKCE